MGITYHPLTADRWRDFTALFGKRGACGGCWCMWFRLTAREFAERKGEKNRRAMHRIVKAGREPGILAYHDGRPIGWCSVAPREEFRRLENSRILAPVDDRPVWSVVCFFVAREWRRRGVTAGLLEAVADFVRRRGGRLLEGYPVDTKKGKLADTFAYHGVASAFRKARFREVARRSDTRPIMRREVRPSR